MPALRAPPRQPSSTTRTSSTRSLLRARSSRRPELRRDLTASARIGEELAEHRGELEEVVAGEDEHRTSFPDCKRIRVPRKDRQAPRDHFDRLRIEAG